MSDFRPISIRMAKQQNLPLSPMEISGVCGRLLCCLAYENDFYCEVKQRMPRQGSQVQSPRGPGQVVAQNVLEESVDVKIDDETVHTFSLQELKSSKSEGQQPSQRKRRRRRR
jgi:cell fate regulator YaaT (PSP1 superfamily)